MHLQRFAEGGAEGTAGAETGAVNSPDAAETGRDLSNVVYGKQDESNVAEKDDSSQETVETFDDLIKGKYREDFQKKTQSIINRRLAGSKEQQKQLQEQITSIKPVMDLLAQKYGVNDPSEIMEALEQDEALYEKESMETGMSVQQVREMKKLQRENESFRQAQAEAERRQNSDKIYANWMEQSEILRETYPNFDFKTEALNDDFNKLLKAGIDVGTAYEVVHKDEILSGAMQYTAQQVRQKTVQNIQARGTRPAENGMHTQPAVQTKTDVNSLTKADREEIERRVRRGEKISF